MFSTPLMPCSSGATTVLATTSALAPGYCPLTRTTGGAISGYCAIGSRVTATAPTMTNTADRTAAKIGRSMKKCEMRISVDPRLRSGGRCFLWMRRDFGAGPRADQPIDDDIVVGVDARDDAHTVEYRPERDVFRPSHIVGIDHHHVLAHLLGADRGFRYEKRIHRGRSCHLKTREHARREGTVRICELRAGANSAGRATDGVVYEIEPTGIREGVLVDQLEFHRRGEAAMRRVGLVLRPTRIAQVGGLIDGELEANGIDRFDGRQQRGAHCAAGDEIADRDAPVANAAVDRGP